MVYIIKQVVNLLVAGLVAACCLGIPIVVAAIGAVGLSFLLNDVFLLPLYAGLLSYIIWGLYRSSQKHQNRLPYLLSVLGALIAFGTLWTPFSAAVFVGLLVIVIGSIWNWVLMNNPTFKE